jgi:hypothetical protein
LDPNPPHLKTNPERFYRSGVYYFLFVHFLSRGMKTNQKKPPVSRYTLRVVQPDDEAAPHAAMRRCQACSGAHNLAIAARLASRLA